MLLRLTGSFNIRVMSEDRNDDATDKDYVYLMKDLYTVAGLADERGWLVEQYDYDAYGGVRMSRCAVWPYAADFDGDGDVDDDDLAVFDSHQNGPGNDPCDVAGPPVVPGWRSDFDCDGDVDGSDYVWFAHAYNGPDAAPRGELTLLTGPMAVSRAGNPYFFTGRRLDALDIDDANTPNHFTDDTPRLTLYDYRARTMDPVLGRFLQRDPLGTSIIVEWGEDGQTLNFRGGIRQFAHYNDGMSLYEYAGSSPLLLTDPSGLVLDWIWGPIWGVGGQIQACKDALSLLLLQLISNARGLPGPFPERSDDFLHCYYSCRVSAGCGRHLAMFLGTIREAIQQFYEDWEDVLDDMISNVDGVVCGTKVRCLAQVAQLRW